MAETNLTTGAEKNSENSVRLLGAAEYNACRFEAAGKSMNLSTEWLRIMLATISNVAPAFEQTHLELWAEAVDLAKFLADGKMLENEKDTDIALLAACEVGMLHAIKLNCIKTRGQIPATELAAPPPLKDGQRDMLARWLIRSPERRVVLWLRDVVKKPSQEIKEMLGRKNTGAIDKLAHDARKEHGAFLRSLQTGSPSKFPKAIVKALTDREGLERLESLNDPKGPVSGLKGPPTAEMIRVGWALIWLRRGIKNGQM